MPSLRHALPRDLVLGLAGKPGHELAFSGVFQKLVWRMHRVITLPDIPDPRCQNKDKLGARTTYSTEWLLSAAVLNQITCRLSSISSALVHAGYVNDQAVHQCGGLPDH